jgi:hypothetical protein
MAVYFTMLVPHTSISEDSEEEIRVIKKQNIDTRSSVEYLHINVS